MPSTNEYSDEFEKPEPHQPQPHEPTNHYPLLILDTPEQIELYRLLQLKYALKIELNTGLRHSRGSILNAINDVLIRNNFIERPLRRKALALEVLDRYIETKTHNITDDPA